MELFYIVSLLFLVATAKVVYLKLSNKEMAFEDFSVKTTMPLRGLLALLIIVHHLSTTGDGIPMFWMFYSWGQYIVAVFFLLTGYGLSVSYMKKGESYLDGFMTHRFGKMLPPYLLCVSLYLGYQFAFIDQFDFLAEISRNFEHAVDVLLETSWYVVAILLFYPSFYIVMKLCKKIQYGIWGMMLWSLGYYMLTKQLELKEYWYMSIFAVNIGMVLAYYEKTIRIVLSKNILLSVILSAVLFGLYYMGLPYINENIQVLPLGYKYKLGGVNILPLFVVMLIYCFGFLQNKVLIFAGKISYEIYLVQGSLCVILYPLLRDMPWMYLTAAMTLSVGMAFGVHKVTGMLWRK